MESETDPLVMYLVVRRRTTRPFSELATAAAIATRRCAIRYRTDERWRGGFEQWWRHSFRKVCLRADPREWERVRLLDHERVGDVACLPPVRRSERDRVLTQMQALGDEQGALPPPGNPPEGLTLIVRTDLGMTAGKTLAQIGHGALAAGLEPATAVGLGVTVTGAGGPTWADFAARADDVVRDGGLTEVAPGSETVLVFWRPGRAG